MPNCVSVSAIVCVLISTVAIIVAFATPNWVKFGSLPATSDYNRLCDCSNCDCGMWMSCDTNLGGGSGTIDNCNWFFDNEFYVEKKLPDWFKAVQGLVACAVVSSLMSLLIGLFSLCCYWKSCNPHQAAGAFISLSFLLMSVSVAVFGAKAHLDHQVDVLVDDTNSITRIFGWSFWVAVGAAGMSLVSSVVYCCVGRNDEYQ